MRPWLHAADLGRALGAGIGCVAPRPFWRVLGVVLLCGCATSEQAVVVRPVEVRIPVPVPCKVGPVDCGEYELSKVRPEDRLIVKGRAALIEVQQREACEARLRAALAACSSQNVGRHP